MMKKVIITLALVIMPATFLAGQNAIENVFGKYAGINGITSVQISKGMFGMLASMDSENEELQKLAASISSVHILHAPAEAAKILGIDFFNEVMRDLPAGNYDELMRVNSKDQQVLFLADENGGVIREILLLVGGNGDNALISIKGNLDMSLLSGLSTINAPGMEHFLNLDR